MGQADTVPSPREQLTPEWFLRDEEGLLLQGLIDAIGQVQRSGMRISFTLVTIPRLLAYLRAMASSLQGGGEASLPPELMRHLEHVVVLPDFALFDVVHEITVLRRCFIRSWLKASAKVNRSDGVAVLDEIIDRLTLAVLERWTEGRQRTFQALDRVSEAVARSAHLTEFLASLVHLLRDMTPGAETATVFLREGDFLVARAISGMEEPVDGTSRVRVGDGFTTTVVGEARSVLIHEAWSDGRVRSSALQARRVRGLYIVPIVSNGVVIGAADVGSTQVGDFSEEAKRRLSAMVERAAASIVQLQLKDALERERDDFVNVLVNDLKGPLSNILGMTSATLRHVEGGDDRSTIERLRKIQAQVDRTGKLLDDLLDVRMLAAGRSRIRLARVEFRPLVEQLLMEWQATSPIHRLEADIQEGAVVTADPGRVTQVLNNLLSNAVKYSPNGGRILVSTWVRPEEVVTWVEDEGIGIEEGALEGVFERYTRMPGGQVQAKGHGIGLFIASELVRAQGGRMWVESERGHGATFFFSLPVWREPVPESSSEERR